MDFKKILFIFVILLLIIAAIPLSQNLLKNGVPFFGKKSSATIDNHTFVIVIAKTDQEKQIGLSSRTTIADNDGMLFPFDKPDLYAFWMRDMKFPIDIIFILKNKIVTIAKNVQPPPADNPNDLPLIKPDSPADSVLEIKAGLSDKYNFKNGDAVVISK